MAPSSLIFLVIIAIWAAYLLQHWVRRREHLATARSVDRFSDAMRVLERRTPLSESDLSAPRPRSYAVSPVRPARPARPEVVVKPAQSPMPAVSTRPAAAVRPTRTFHALARMSACRLRGLSLLLALSGAVVVPSLAAFAVLPWWSVAVAVAVLVADFVWLRHAAKAQRATRRAKANGVKAPVRRSAAASVRSGSRAVLPPVARPAAPAPAAVAGVAEVAEPSESPYEAYLSGWAPVAVPPPTYTLKAKAERPEPAVGTEPASARPSSFDGLVDEDELDGLLDRRRASGA